MKKKHFLILILLFIVFIYPTSSNAHTISQHLEELYGQTYLPLFIIAKLLPFIGLGMLANATKSSQKNMGNQWFFILAIIAGIAIGYYFDVLQTLLVANKMSILIVGVLLLILNRPINFIAKILMIFFGCSLGYEYGLNIAHAVEFKWLFLLLLSIGISIFLTLSRFHFFKKGIYSTIRISVGIMLVIAGLIVILLT